MTEFNLTEFAKFIGQPVHVAKQIVEQEQRESKIHGNGDVRGGYNYTEQRWCGCRHCTG